MLRNIARGFSYTGFIGGHTNICSNTVRTLYSGSSLGIDAYIANRDKVKSQFTSTTERFRQKMQEFTTDNDKQNMIFTDDLKNIIHLAEKDDISLVVKMVKKFSGQNQELRFGTYIFGPVAMRMFYYLNEAQTALQCFKENSSNGFFDQWTSYQILLDLLYNNGMYQDVLDTYDIIREKQMEGSKFPKYAMIIVFGALYKLNTKESLDYAIKLWKAMANAGHIPMRRSATFAAGLSLAQNAPQIALEILYNTKQQNYMTVRNMKVIALLELNRVEDVIPILRSVLETETLGPAKQTFCKEVIAKTQLAMEKFNNKEMKLDYDRIVKFLFDQGNISDKTIDELLCSEITVTPMVNTNQSKNKAFLNESFSRSGNNSGRQRNQYQRNERPGLTDMY